MRSPRAPALGVSLCVASVGVASAQTTYDFRGSVETDLRLALPGKPPPSGPNGQAEKWRFERVDNTARFGLTGSSGQTRGVFDLAFVHHGFGKPNDLDSLQTRDQSDPFTFESDALYVDISDFAVERLDLRIGRQIVQWGSADRFNPTSVINPLDLEDPIKFGDRVANEMLVLSYTAPWTVEGDDLTLFDELTFTLVGVPLHRTGQYPGSASQVFTDPDLFVNFVDSAQLRNFAGIQKDFIELGGTFDYSTEVETPEAALKNAQFAGRVSMIVAGVDLGFMYYQGYSDVLRPIRVEGVLPEGASAFLGELDLSDPNSVNALRDTLGVLKESGVEAPLSTLGPIGIHAVLGFPEVKVVGFDAATSLDFIGGLGLWVEAALTMHDAQDLIIDFGDPASKERLLEEGRFWKVAAGTDYSILSWWYLNVQYLHGFVDEFGTDNMNDYVVAGSDLKFFSEQLTMRLFGIYQMQDQSHVIYPALMGRFWPNTELTLGAFIMRGEDDSKFGSVAAGANQLFFTGKYSY